MISCSCLMMKKYKFRKNMRSLWVEYEELRNRGCDEVYLSNKVKKGEESMILYGGRTLWQIMRWNVDQPVLDVW